MKQMNFLYGWKMYKDDLSKGLHTSDLRDLT